MVLSPGAGRASAAGGLPFLSPAAPDFSLLFCPLSPRPPSRREGGRFLVYFAGGFAPGTPAFNRLRHVQFLPCRCPAGVCPRRRQFGAKPIESPFHGQCRQPRRGGTGGDGTIRRKRRRRLRWSSPPGQGEQVPPGVCLSCRLPTLTLVYFFAPIPPTPFPAGRGRL